MSLDTFASICSVLGMGADELLWGVPCPPDAVLDLWQPALQEQRAGGQKADNYAVYVRIMKSVAEIMNEA